MEFIYCRRLKSQYFRAPKSGAPRRRASPQLRVLQGVFLRHCRTWNAYWFYCISMALAPLTLGHMTFILHWYSCKINKQNIRGT